jgi:hypothetical protein
MKRKQIAILALALMLGACGGPFVVCDTRTGTVSSEAGLCREWSGQETVTPASLQKLCTFNLGGAVLNTNCPTTDRVAQCETDQGFGLVLTYSYYASVFTLKEAEAQCKACQGALSCTFKT